MEYIIYNESIKHSILIDEICCSYVNSKPAAFVAIASNELFQYIRECALFYIKFQDFGELEKGIVALKLEGFKQDPRDSFAHIALLLYVYSHFNRKKGDFFQEILINYIADAWHNQISQMFRNDFFRNTSNYNWLFKPLFEKYRLIGFDFKF